MNFKKFKLNNIIQKNIEEMGYIEATEIQENVIPRVMMGKDVIGLAQTGTGKTAAFALPLLNGLLDEDPDKKTKILILTPTRELAIQIRDNIMAYRKGTDFKCSVILGGVNQQSQKAVIKRGFEILVATPGRLKDLLETRKVRLDTVRTVVLDEADTMLDMGFIHDITYIISKTPKKRQTLLFSATMPDTVKKLSNAIMTNPETIKVNTIIPKDKIKQEVYYVDTNKKIDLLFDLISTKENPSTIIFTRTKQGADDLEKALKEYNIKVSVLHGDKKQSNRFKALKDFKEGKSRILIATDIAARGIDIENLGLVINYDVPDKKELYIHRIGRTARAGKDGKAITLCSSKEIKELRNVEKAIGLTLPKVEHKYEMRLKEHKISNRPKNAKGNYKKDNSKKNKKDYKGTSNKNFKDNNKEFKGKKEYSSKKRNSGRRNSR